MLVIRGQRIVLPDREQSGSIHIDRGVITNVAPFDDVPPDADIVEAGTLVVSPGLIDAHVHVNEPGRTEWEGFDTATRAAAAGGVTTIVDMPLNSIPPTISVAALMVKAEAMDGKCWVDVGLWGGAVPGNAPALRDMVREGALGFKCFLVDSGVPEFRHLDADGLAEALDALRDANAPLLVHAELPQFISDANGSSYRAYLQSRPRAAEDAAIDLVFDKARRGGARAHIVHLS